MSLHHSQKARPLCKPPILAIWPPDLFVYLPVQILPDLVVAMERQGFTPAEVKGGYGYRPKEEEAEDNLARGGSAH